MNSKSVGRFLLIILSLISASAFAQNKLDEGVGNAMSMKPDPQNELAHYWFQSLFGDFIWGPWGTSGSSVTLLSDALGYVNILAWLLGAVIAWYQIFGGAINTAHEGEVLGKAWSSAWLPIRNAIAFFLITPASAVGGGVLSFCQIFIVWLIIIGSNGGTLLWSHVAQQVSSGTTIYPSTSTVPINFTTSILKKISCANALYEINGTEIGVKTPQGAHSGYVGAVALGEADSWIRFGDGGRCGEITLPSTSTLDQLSENGKLSKEANAAARQAIAAHVARLAAIDGFMRQSVSPDGLASGGNFLANAEQGTELYAPALSRLSEIAERVRAAHSQFNADINNVIGQTIYGSSNNAAFLKQLTSGGWANSGTWYFQLSKREGLAQGVMNNISAGSGAFVMPNTCSGFSKLFSNCPEPTKLYENIAAADKAIELASASAAGGSEFLETTPSISNLSNVDPMGYMNHWGASVAQKVMRAVNGFADITGAAEGMYGESSVTGSENAFINPFLTTSNIGHTYIDIGLATWAMGIASSTAGVTADKASGAIGDAIPGFSGAKAAIANILSIIATALAAVGALLLGLGFTLAYVVPFLPILTWVMMLASYLVSVVEAVVGAPLAVIMMATPEGDGIVGAKQQTAIQLVAVIILKPALMVVGLLASITMGGIIFGTFNRMFWKTADLTSSGVIDVLAILSIYTAFAYQICKFTVGIMPKIPDQILKWFTTGVGESFGDTTAAANAENGVDAAKGSVNESMRAGSSAIMAKLDARRESIKGKGGDDRMAA